MNGGPYHIWHYEFPIISHRLGARNANLPESVKRFHIGAKRQFLTPPAFALESLRLCDWYGLLGHQFAIPPLCAPS